MPKKRPEVQKMIKNFMRDRETLTLSEIAKKYGIAKSTIYNNKELIAETHGINADEIFSSRKKKNADTTECCTPTDATNVENSEKCMTTSTTNVEETKRSEDFQKCQLKDFDEKCEIARKAINGMIELIQATRKQLEEN